MTGKYKPYPEYKDSGVEWFGEIPKHWAVSKIKFIAPYQVGWTPLQKMMLILKVKICGQIYLT